MSLEARRKTRLQRSLKALERGYKKVLLAMLTRMAARSAEAQPDWNARKQRVLFLRHDRIGDMIVSSAVIRAIAQAHPNIELDVLASPLNAAVISQEPLIHGIVEFDRHKLPEYWRLWRRLRRARYDVVVDSMIFSQSLTTLLLMIATGAPHRVGVPKAGRPNVYTMLAEPGALNAHHVEHLAELAEPFGTDANASMDLHIELTASERERARLQWGQGSKLLVNVSAGNPFRRWPDDRYAAIARHLRETVVSARVLVMHAPGDKARAESIANAAGVIRADTPDVRAALAMVEQADFVFTPDTSVVHAASAFHRPAVTLFTSDQATRWRLFRTAGRDVVYEGATLADVPLDAAIDAVNDVLRAIPLPLVET